MIEHYENLNQNQYNINPFQTSNAPDLLTFDENKLVHDFYGLELMDTHNIRQRVMTDVSDEVEGVTGRWTFFSQIIS